MRILHLIQKYYPVIGGSENSTRELSTELVKMGHRVSVFTTDALELDVLQCSKYITESSFNDSGVNVYRFHVVNSMVHKTLRKICWEIPKVTKRLGIAENDISLQSKALSQSLLVPSLYHTLANSRCFDVVNGTMTGWGDLLFLEKICLKNKTPFIFTPRSHTLDPNIRITSAIWLKIAQDATALIVFTQPEKDYFIRQGVDQDKIFVTGISIYPEKSQPSDPLSFRLRHKIPINHKIVLHIGRMDEYKGAELIISSMKEVWEREPETSLVIIGKSTAYTRQIEQIVKKEKRIILLPDASESTKRDALFCSSLLVHPSKQESFGRVFLEAWAAEKPVIGSRTPVNKYLIDEWKDGLLLNLLDPKELAEKIIFLLKNESIANEMGKRGNSKFLRNYTWEKIAQRTFEVYKWAQEQSSLR